MFLCSLVFEDHVYIAQKDPALLVNDLQQNGNAIIASMLSLIIDFAKGNPNLANKSWPTLLESMHNKG